MVVLIGVVGEVALMVVLMQIGIGGFSFEEVVIGIFFIPKACISPVWFPGVFL